MSGKYFEELEVGMEFKHLPHRTITETDNFLFTALTHNPQPLHLDAEFAKSTQHGQIIVNSLFTLGLVIGLSVGDKIPTLWHWLYFLESTPQSMLATKITEKRESKSKPDRGIVWFEHVGINQRDEIICECLRKGMMLKLHSYL